MISGNIKQSFTSVSNEGSKVRPTKNSVGTNVKLNKNDDNANKNTFEEIFIELEKELPQYVIAQEDFLSDLSIAFKRPILYQKNEGIKNVVFITGPRGTGRHLSVKVATNFLSKKKLLISQEINIIDLAKYKLEKDVEALFIPDIFRALYSRSQVIVFDNLSECHPMVTDYITKLVVDEKLKMSKRYQEQNNGMSDITGVLEFGATDEILVNNKYIFFITEKNESYIKNTFPSKFLNKVRDILSTSELNVNALKIITSYHIEETLEKISKNLNIVLTVEDNVMQNIVDNLDSSKGALGIFEYIESNIYNSLVELVIHKEISSNNVYKISAKGNNLLLTCDGYEKVISNMFKDNTEEILLELDKELDNVIGLKNIKEFIRGLKDNIRIQRQREINGEKKLNISLHMVFTGNTGTGKTTIARIVAKYLKTLGYLSSGHLIEITRNDLVGMYVGETAQKTFGKINSAKGGILFIDEAYSLVKDKNDIFGLEAVDTLVKYMEDYRDDFIVIMAGYKEEMAVFLETNSGLLSRFNNQIEFGDYNNGELLNILKVTVKGKGYSISEADDKEFLELFERKRISGKNDSGNGRLVRNLVEKAITNSTIRLSNEDIGKLSLDKLSQLTLLDFEIINEIEIDLDKRLNDIVGLESIKNFVKGLQKQLIANNKRKKMGISLNNNQSLNMIFTGNPGTGKTTIARVIAELMRDMGILKIGQVIETDRSGLIGQYLGETTKKTTEIFRKAMGGVLFIDEAYALVSNSNDPYGKEAIDTLVKLVEEHREDTVVILAGYSKEMSGFLNTNSGLQSRFPLQINFPDYSLEELYSIGMIMINEKGFKLEKAAEEDFLDFIDSKKRISSSNQGNGRMVRNIVEELIRSQSNRIADTEVIEEKDIQTIKKEDFVVENVISEKYDLESNLENIIGLEQVKNYIRSLQAQIKIRNERKKIGLLVDTSQSLHMIFKGNPGTGKTTMARIVADVLYNLGILRSRKLVETDRSGLVAGYVGQTALKTKTKIDEALGGVLFIDEAYALASRGSENDFGKEAIDTLVKAMDDNRDDLLIILAGYNNDMDEFLNMNPGLKSRFPNIIEFEDYTAEDLITICSNMFSHNGYIVTEDGINKLKSIFEIALINSNFGNGRYSRNIMEKSIRNQSLRLAKFDDLNRDMLITITAEDIEEI
ncbi:MAG: AAA family ATPase [Clostridium sp.]|uniref:AAA family ATPase n=1 Tax=Clostridium sp. TaxID=1506 RepID=UPI003D6D8B37